LFLGFRYQNYTGKAIFMPPSIGVGIANYPQYLTCDVQQTHVAMRYLY
jgi:hypothetical protein